MLIRALKLQLTGEQTLVGALNALVIQKWAASVVNGQTILSTAEAGGLVTFTFDRAFTPAHLATMAEEALAWCEIADSHWTTERVAPYRIVPMDSITVSRHKRTRYWAVRSADGELICVCVYKRGVSKRTSPSVFGTPRLHARVSRLPLGRHRDDRVLQA